MQQGTRIPGDLWKAEWTAENTAREWYPVSRLCFCIRKLKAPDKNQIQPFTKTQKAPDSCFPVFWALKLRQCAEGHQCFTCYFSILENWQKLRCAKHYRPKVNKMYMQSCLTRKIFSSIACCWLLFSRHGSTAWVHMTPFGWQKGDKRYFSGRLSPPCSILRLCHLASSKARGKTLHRRGCYNRF